MPYTIVLLLLGSALVSAQDSAAKLSPEQLQKLSDMTDELKTALRRGDLDGAGRLASDLMLSLHRQRMALTPSPKQKFATLEAKVPSSGMQRFYALPDLAKAAVEAGEYMKAEFYARELLAPVVEVGRNWNSGNAIHDGNLVIGRVALARDKDVMLAKASLLAAGRTNGSPGLNSFGPNMSLARDLIEAGERDTVLEYFNLCKRFWSLHRGRLDDWSALVKAGRMPDFGANLVY